MLALLASVPDVIWSGVIASVLTLSGVLISNRSNTGRLKIQLQHDATEKTKERTATLRREVYLRTAEELVKVNAHLAGLPQIDITKSNVADGLQGFFSAAARLQLVAEPHTALLVNKLAAEYGELVFLLMAQLIPVSQAKSDIQIADDLYTKAQAEVTRILGQMTRLNESGKPEPEVFLALQTSFTFQNEQSRKFAEQRGDAWKRFTASTFIFQKFLLTQIRSLAPKQIPVMVEIRRDLGLTSELKELEAQLHEQMRRMESHFDELIAKLSDESQSVK